MRVSLDAVSLDGILDEVWAVIGPLFPAAKATERPPVERRVVVEFCQSNLNGGAIHASYGASGVMLDAWGFFQNAMTDFY